MKRLLPFAVILFTLINSCTTKQPALLNPKSLQSSFIKILNDSSYHLKTAKGATVNIPANCFDVAAGSSVDIEIKEAYSMQDILKAALTTMSNGKLLQSGGMIFFNATVDKKPVKFLREVGLTLPSKVYNDSMKVFKGELTADNTINWVEPKNPDTSAAMKSLFDGEALHKANCANCHKPSEDFTGPKLGGARLRGPSASWSYRFVTNVNRMLDEDPYARFLHRKYGSKMTQFNGLKFEEIKAILDYCDNEALLRDPSALTFEPQSYLRDSSYLADSVYKCYDTIPVIKDTGFTSIEPVEKEMIDTSGMGNYTPNVEIPMYSFNIDQSGWYNIDCFIDNNINAVKEVTLTAGLSETNFSDIQVYLCIPDKKLLADGSSENKDQYTFYYGSSRIKLLLKAEAFIFAVGKKNDQLYYGITGFSVKDEQHITVNMKPTSEQNVINDLRKNKIQDVQIDKTEPVIQSFIKPDSSNQQIEKQVIERPCDQPMSNTQPVAFASPQKRP